VARVVRCPRCGSLDAGSIEPIGIEFDRMHCHTCGYDEICDVWQISFDWNENVPDPNVSTVLPDDRFHALWTSLGAEGPSAAVLATLREAYGEPHRAYHDATHIGACLAIFDQVHALATHPAEVEAALWFHDAIYDTHASDNEARSAILASDLLGKAGVPADRIERIADHINATRTHESTSQDGKLVIDIDLSILGSDPATYDRFEAAILREYSWVPEDAFRAGRAAVLRSFLDRPAIYTHLADRYDARARANLTRALSSLEPPRG
jgi:predicted metal-dependent HD superfamily phosphohydrolase